MMTKDQERKALEKIKAIVAETGEESYISFAFKGVFQIAEDNINNDFADSWMDRWSAAVKENEGTRNDLREAQAELKGTKEELETMTASQEHWKKTANDWKESANTNYSKFIEEKTKAEQAEEEAKALKEEIITLKAKLYDLMTV